MIEEILKELQKKYPDQDWKGINESNVSDGVKKAIKLTEKKVVEIVESCRVFRNTFITKKELINKLEEAFPEK